MNEKKAIKSASWYVISSLLIKALSFITAPIFTHILLPSEYGSVSNFFAWEAIIAVFVGLGIDYSVGRAKLDYEEHFNSYLSSIQMLCIFAVIIIYGVLAVFKNQFSSFSGITHNLIIILVLYSLTKTFIAFFQSKLRFEYKYKGNIIIAFYSIIATTALSLILLCCIKLEDKGLARIYGLSIPTICLGSVCFFIILQKGKKCFDIKIWKYALAFSLPMIPHALSMIILEQTDRIMIVKYIDLEAAGLYSFAYTFAMILSVVTNSIMNGWQPWFFENLNNNNVEPINKSVKILGTLLLFFLAAYLCVIPEFMKIMGRREFWIAKYATIPVIAGCAFQFLYNLFVQLELFNKKTGIIALGSVSAAVINLILNFIFIPKFGYMAAGYTTMASYFLLMIYHLCICKLYFKTTIFNVKTILSFVLAILVLVFAYLILYKFNIIVRYIFGVIALLVICLFNRNLMKSIINIVRNKFSFNEA